MEIRDAAVGDADALARLLADYLRERLPGHPGTLADAPRRYVLRGTAYDRASPTGRFYERFAVGFDSAECHCAGRAFRRLAELAGVPTRTLVRSLPPKEWNHEP
jgi:hypothetical protein